MNVIALILLIIAAVIFALAPRGLRDGSPYYRYYGRTDLGLLFLTVGLIVQFCAKSHSVTF